MNLKCVTIIFLVLLSCFTPNLTTSTSNNQDRHTKITSSQSYQIRWNLTVSYSVINDSTGPNFVVGTSLKFFQNITFFNYGEPPINYQIYNSTNNSIFSIVPAMVNFGNKSFTANQSVTTEIWVPLTTSMIPRTDTYSIYVTMITINRTYSNSFSAIVTNSSIHINFKNNVSTDTGLYNVTHNSTFSITATITKSRSLPINVTWFLLPFFPLVIFSRRSRRKNNNMR